jgi:microcystin-dependent protein
MPYLTPEEIPASDFVCRTIQIPNTLDAIAAVNGAILALSQAYNWEKSSPTAVAPSDMADAMFTMYYNYQRSRCDVIGEIKMLMTDVIPDNWLLCDGSFHSRDDYPLLWAILFPLENSGGDETGFYTPDFSRRSPVGVSTEDRPDAHLLGETWGAEELEILPENMPAHSHYIGDHAHSEGIAVPTIINGGIEAPAAAATAATGLTGYGGGGDTSEVGEGDTLFMYHPVYCVVFAIVAR